MKPNAYFSSIYYKCIYLLLVVDSMDILTNTPGHDSIHTIRHSITVSMQAVHHCLDILVAQLVQITFRCIFTFLPPV